jgi:glutamate synthase (NADPH/NADH) small chain
MPEPPAAEDKAMSWPRWPIKLRTSSSQEEGALREFSVTTARLEGKDGRVSSRVCQRDGEELRFPADLILLAMGFTGAPDDSILADIGATVDRVGHATSRNGVFACGDMRRGQSLVVWAIREGRDCADAVNAFLAVEKAQPASVRYASTG